MLSEDEQEEITKDLYRYFENNVDDFGYIVGWSLNTVLCALRVFYRNKSENKITSEVVPLDRLKRSK